MKTGTESVQPFRHSCYADFKPRRISIKVAAKILRKEIHRSAHSLESQDATGGLGYLERYEQARSRIETLEQEKLERTVKSKAVGRFVHSIRRSTELITGFDEALWVAIVDNVIVTENGEMVFGSEISPIIGTYSQIANNPYSDP